MYYEKDCICAKASGNGGAVSLIRMSGNLSFDILALCFTPVSKTKVDPSNKRIFFGTFIVNGDKVDEVLVTVFKAPNSYTGENIVEISCHASPYIEARILEALMDNGARLANPGEFTQRAFFNGKLDLSQAEGVADLIASQSQAEHQLAMSQLSGGISGEMEKMRAELIHFTSMLELELDFGEEDVEFASRYEMKGLLSKLKSRVKSLIDSFAYGNAIKNGVPVAIVGKPNVGKSTLLNTLLREDIAIVSDIAGTTRDAIEETCTIDGVLFRFIDTAGLRDTNDKIEAIGVQRAREKANKALIVIYLYDNINATLDDIKHAIDELQSNDNSIMLVENKIDESISSCNKARGSIKGLEITRISAKNNQNIDGLKQKLLANINTLKGDTDVVLSNARHHQALKKSLESLEEVSEGLEEGLSNELLSFHLRDCLSHLGSISGEINTDRDILGNIFKNFCIGK
ncbi:MAG: tRNA uridine-5-carboxymethylaminomethyl(34) synthesis GTPase MnmE, partial [Bacteroidales bacterium]